jgi:two-component sensor histidine kinase
MAVASGLAAHTQRPAPRWPWLAAMLSICWLSMAGPVHGTKEMPTDDNIFVDQPVNQDSPAERLLSPELRLGAWIWAPQTLDKQTCRFWRKFHIPQGATVARAKLRISVDNGYRLMLNGRVLGNGSDWRSITEYDPSLLLKPGNHVLAVEAFNDNREAGMLFGLTIELTDGRVIHIPSDTRWRVAPATDANWQIKKEAPPSWAHTVVLSEFLLRAGFWHKRTPTMIVKVPTLLPIETHFWQSVWFQAALWSIICTTALLYLRVLTKYSVQSKAQAMLHTERARIARDIHDELGARLTELALEGEVAQTELPAESTVRPKLEALCEKARAVSGAMDELVWMVNSRRDTLRDFANFACRHAQRFLSQTPIRCRLDVDADLPEAPFELPVRRNLLLGVKEALNNAAKYSKATEILLRIQHRGQTLIVVVEDNGTGFDRESADPSRNGLSNMVERMKEVGGECRIITKPGAGCQVEFHVPLSRVPRRRHVLDEIHNPALATMRGMPPSPAPKKGVTPT